MIVTCSQYRERSGRRPESVALVLGWPDGFQIEISGWSLYERSGLRYLNPPAVRHGGGFANIVGVGADKAQREEFRQAALAAIDEQRIQAATDYV